MGKGEDQGEEEVMIVARLAAVALLAATGCSHASLPTGWTKPGASTQDFDRDHYACYRDARQEWNRSWSMWGGLFTASSRVEEHYAVCMKGHGWTRPS
jgi:hypothetical protein